MALCIKNIVMGVLAMFSEGFFDLMAVAVVADLLGLTTIRAVIIAVDAALCIGLLRDAVAGAGNVALADFNDSLPSGVCQRVVSDSPRCLTAGAPPKPMHACPGAVHTATRGLRELCKALPGGSQPHSGVGGVQPGGVLGQIPLFPAADVPLPGTLHLGYLIGGVFFAVPLDVPGIQLPQLLLCPLGRVAKLRKHGEEGVAAVPAAQPGTPKSGCMILPEICTDNSGKIQKRR